jgi:hypothetical protein
VFQITQTKRENAVESLFSGNSDPRFSEIKSLAPVLNQVSGRTLQVERAIRPRATAAHPNPEAVLRFLSPVASQLNLEPMQRGWKVT